MSAYEHDSEMEARQLEADEAFDISTVPGGNDTEELFSKKMGDWYMESYDDKNRVEVFVDGTCEKNDQEDARGGCGVWFGMGHPGNDSFPLPPSDSLDSSNRTELFAVFKGLFNAREEDINSIRLFTNSRYVFDGLSEYIYEWEEKENGSGWQTIHGAKVQNSNMWKVQNINLWKKLRKISQQFDECIIQWVPRTHPVLVKAGRLAKHGAEI